MTLDILITHYNEPFEVIKPLLDSIQIQRNVDFSKINVIIANDGTKLNIPVNYNFNITILNCKHKGVSATRNSAFKKGNFKYVIFCDCDDCFYSVNALNIIFHLLENKPDVIVNNFYEEVNVNNEIYLTKHENDEVFVHGKIYSRAYLLSNNLQFNPILTVHEDYYFNKLCLTLTKNKIILEEPIYLWITRKESVCRKDNDYLLKTYANLINVNDCLIDRLLKEGYIEKASEIFVQFTFTTYFDLITEPWQCSKYLNETENYFREFFIKYRKYYDTYYTKNKSLLYNNCRQTAVSKGLLFEPISFLEWIQKILIKKEI